MNLNGEIPQPYNRSILSVSYRNQFAKENKLIKLFGFPINSIISLYESNSTPEPQATRDILGTAIATIVEFCSISMIESYHVYVALFYKTDIVESLRGGFFKGDERE